ncbi:MAG: hypothetical protein GF375_03175, partial [Candidatus Omnitrophica bacterium]|nr:hypothetical protein [Candidatus Omnitrophota bacterium]
DKEGVFKEKLSLLEASPDTKGVLNGEDTYLCRLRNRKNIYWFGRNRDNDLYYRLKKREKAVSHFLIQDKHEVVLPIYREKFIVNAAAALLTASLLGYDLKKMAEKINDFDRFPSMRMEMQELNGYLVLNDAYNSNPYSLRESLKVLKYYKCPKIAIIGDMLELGRKSVYYHKNAAHSLRSGGFEWVVLTGRNSRHIQEELKNLGCKNTVFLESCEKIAGFIKKHSQRRNKLKKRYLLFLKGSRSMGLEKVIDYLK